MVEIGAVRSDLPPGGPRRVVVVRVVDVDPRPEVRGVHRHARTHPPCGIHPSGGEASVPVGASDAGGLIRFGVHTPEHLPPRVDEKEDVRRVPFGELRAVKGQFGRRKHRHHRRCFAGDREHHQNAPYCQEFFHRVASFHHTG